MSSKMQPTPRAKKAIPRKRSRLPTKLDLLRLIHFSPKEADTSEIG
mgnify:CR=1 FL=1